MERSIRSIIHPIQSSRSEGSFMKPLSVEVLPIWESSENTADNLNNFMSLCPIGVLFDLERSLMYSIIYPTQLSLSEGSVMKRSSVEVLQISDIIENSKIGEVGNTAEDTVIGEKSLITRNQERHRYI